MYDTVHNVNTTVTQLSALQTQLNVSLSELREGLYNRSMNCTAETCDLVPSPDSINLAVDWSSVCTATVKMSRHVNKTYVFTADREMFARLNFGVDKNIFACLIMDNIVHILHYPWFNFRHL